MPFPPLQSDGIPPLSFSPLLYFHVSFSCPYNSPHLPQNGHGYALSPFPDPVLQSLCPDGKISSSACTKIMDFSKKESQVREKCDLSKVKIRPDDGRIHLIIKRRPVSSTTYPGLIDKLYEHFYGIQTLTLEDFFEVWMEWRDHKTATSKKTSGKTASCGMPCSKARNLRKFQ